MKYCIVDLEWIRHPKTYIVQIGAIMFNEDDNEVSRFFRVIKPSCEYSPESIKFMPITANEIDSGVSFDDALRQFVSWLNGCYELLVWDDDARSLLYTILKNYERLPYHKIISLRKELKPVNGERSFKETCKRLGIKIRAPLHNSINDCTYLSSVYRILRNSPPWASEEVEIRYCDDGKTVFENCLNSCLFITMQGSKTYHRKTCYHIRNKTEEKKILLFNMTHSQIIGCEPCKDCMDEKEQAKRFKAVYYTKRQVWDYDALEQYCKSLKIKCTVYPDWVYVITNMSTWFFKRDVPEILLFHENYIKRNTKKNKWKEDYHIQNKRFKDPMEAVYYIYCHDKTGYGAWS